jgi:hypothetical protein
MIANQTMLHRQSPAHQTTILEMIDKTVIITPQSKRVPDHLLLLRVAGDLLFSTEDNYRFFMFSRRY